MTVDRDELRIQSALTFFGDKNVQRGASIGATGAIVLGLIHGSIEYSQFGLAYPTSLLSALLAIAFGSGYHVLRLLGEPDRAIWTLVWGMWVVAMVDATFQAGLATPSVIVLPMLILLVIWASGDKRHLIVMVALSLIILVSGEVAYQQGYIQREGLSSPYMGLIVAVVVLGTCSYITLLLFDNYMERFDAQTQTASELRSVTDKYRRIVETIVDPFYQANLQGEIVTISPSIEPITGYSPDELIGKKLASFYAIPEKREEFLALMRADGEVKDFEAELICKDGSGVWISTHAHYWTDDENNILGVEGIVRDATQRREVQKGQARAQKIEVLDQLTTGMAHDFNNLLGIILGASELIKFRSGDTQELVALAKVIEQAANRASDVTKKMVAFTELDSGETSVLDVNQALRDLAGMLRSSLTSEISLDLDLHDNLWLVDSFPGEFQDAIVNLVVNARDGIEADGAIRIRTDNLTVVESSAGENPDIAAGDYVHVLIADNGAGIPAAIQEKVFEPFFTTKPRDLGTGLGLSMVYGFVRRSGGEIRLKSVEGEGTRIELFLPRTSEARCPEKPGAPPAIGDLPQGAGEKILLVEDESALGKLNKVRLENLGYEVDLVDNGVKAVTYLESGRTVDLLLTDVVMPGGITGIDLVKIARELRPDIKMLICSGLLDVDELVADFDDLPEIMRKPFTTGQMAEVVRRTIDA